MRLFGEDMSSLTVSTELHYPVMPYETLIFPLIAECVKMFVSRLLSMLIVLGAIIGIPPIRVH